MEQLEINAPPKELVLAPVSTIVRNLDRMYGRNVWPKYELETLSLDMGFAFPELLQDKLNVLQLVIQHPEMYFNDVLFYLHAVNVINNNVSDFDTFPFPSSLEIAYAHSEVKKIFGNKEYGNPIIKTVIYILKLEGYSVPVEPFSEIGIKKEDLVEGQTEQDTKNKEIAIKKYIETMNGEPQ